MSSAKFLLPNPSSPIGRQWSVDASSSPRTLHTPRSAASRQPLARTLLCAVALAGAMAATVAPSAHAGTVWKCVGDDGVVAYVSQKPKGGNCTVAAQFAAPPKPVPIRASAPDPQAAVPPAAPAVAPEVGANVPAAPLPGVQALPPVPSDGALSADFTDFGDPNAAAVAAKLNAGAGGFRYVQIGDSHTAGDYMTDELRQRLQAQLGNGGDGWAMPMRVPGQRLARVSFDVDGWSLINSRNQTPADYPFGGFIAQVVRDGAVLTIKSRQDEPAQAITAIIRQSPGDLPLQANDANGQRLTIASPVADGQWHAVSFSARLPLMIVAQHSPQTAIGGWWLSAMQPAGAVVSAVGINGAEQSQWSRWRNDWMADLQPGQPDLIALAYGTNEAFGKALDENAMRADLEAGIDRLRQNFPQAAILIIGAPESLSGRGGGCGRRAPSLDAVQRIQREVAAQRKTLYWDWQQAMGGTCSMKSWIAQGLGRGDGVHFSAAGYTRLGDDLFQGLRGLATRAPTGSESIGAASMTPRASAATSSGGAAGKAPHAGLRYIRGR